MQRTFAITVNEDVCNVTVVVILLAFKSYTEFMLERGDPRSTTMRSLYSSRGLIDDRDKSRDNVSHSFREAV